MLCKDNNNNQRKQDYIPRHGTGGGAGCLGLTKQHRPGRMFKMAIQERSSCISAVMEEAVHRPDGGGPGARGVRGGQRWTTLKEKVGDDGFVH